MDDTLLMRQATLEDVPLIVRHRRAMFDDMGVTATDRLNAMDAVYGDWVRDKLAKGEYLGWFLTTPAGEVVAGAGLWLAEWQPTPFDLFIQRGYVMNVYTERDYRGRGLARRLMTQVLDWCQNNGIRTVTLHASEQGRALYESMGFEQTNEMRLVFSDVNDLPS